MAIACFLLLTLPPLPPLPLLNVPLLRSCMAFLTFRDAPLEYLRAIMFSLALASGTHVVCTSLSRSHFAVGMGGNG